MHRFGTRVALWIGRASKLRPAVIGEGAYLLKPPRFSTVLLPTAQRAPFFLSLALLLVVARVPALAQDNPEPQIAAPELITAITPVYPDALLRQAEPPSGQATVLITIDEQGQVSLTEIVNASLPEFGQAASEALQAARFRPARLADGSAIAVQIEVLLEFVPPLRQVVADDARLAGRVFIRGQKRPLAGATVLVRSAQGAEWVTSTSEAGDFQLAGLSATTVTVRVGAAGFDPYVVQETLAAGDALTVEYYVLPQRADQLRLIVEGQRERREVSRQTVTLQELVTIPGVGQDAIRVVQILPGVITPSDLSGDLLVRGSDSNDNFIEIDGMPVPYVYHFFSISSVLSSFLIENIDFYPSNFSARYGNAMGGALIVETRSPDDKVWRGSVNVGTLLAEAYTEGPITEDLSILVSARRSYFDAILKAAIPDNTGFSLTTAPQFSDYQLKLNYRPSPHHKASFLINGADDRLQLLLDKDQLVDPEQFSDFRFVQGFHQARVRYTYEPNRRLRNEMLLGLGTENTRANIDAQRLQFYLYNDILRLRDELAYKFDSGTELRAGTRLDLRRTRVDIFLPEPPRRGDYDYDFLTAPRERARQTLGNNLYTVYGELQQELGPVVMVAGLHANKFNLADYWQADPRGQIRYQMLKGTLLKAAAGVYSQVPEAQTFVEEAGGNPESSPPTGLRSYHYLLGVEQSLPWELVFLAEGYYKDLDRLARQNEDFLDPIRYLNDASGRAYGLELTLRKPFSERVYGWLNYSWSRSLRREPGDAEFTASEFDQPHVFNAVVSWTPARTWRLGARYRYASGNPIYSTDRAIYYADRLSYLQIQSETRDVRQPSYQRLDVRVDKTWLYERWKLTNYFEVLNVYLHDNPLGTVEAYDFSEYEIINSFPILINFGLKADF